MKNFFIEILTAIIDLVMPPRAERRLFERIRPEDFYEKTIHWQKEIYPNVRAIFPYQDDKVKAVVLALKKEKDMKAARMMAYSLSRFIIGHHLEGSIVVPMPISRQRRRERGYNQCEIVTKIIPRYVKGIKVKTNILERPVHTKKFAVQGRSERLEAMHSGEHKIFRLRRTHIAPNVRIIVIDDVVTTGATMAEAMRTMRDGGAEDVIGLAFAH